MLKQNDRTPKGFYRTKTLAVCMLVLGFTLTAEAVEFLCWPPPIGMVSAFEYASKKCPGGEVQKGSLESGEKAVVCVEVAYCEPLTDKFVGEVEEITGKKVSEILKDPQSKDFQKLETEFVNRKQSRGKISNLICTGTGKLGSDNQMEARCPPANECREDVQFNFQHNSYVSAGRPSAFFSPNGDGKGSVQ